MVNQPTKKPAAKARPAPGAQRPPAGRPGQKPVQRRAPNQPVAQPRPVATNRPVVGRQPAPNQGMQMAQMRRPQQGYAPGPRPAQAPRQGPPRPQQARPAQHRPAPANRGGPAPVHRPVQSHGGGHKSGSSTAMKTAGVIGGAAAIGGAGYAIHNHYNSSSTNVVNEGDSSYTYDNSQYQYDNSDNSMYQQGDYYDNSEYYDNGEYYYSDNGSDHGDRYNDNYDPEAQYSSDNADDQPAGYAQPSAQDIQTENQNEEPGCCAECCGDDCCECKSCCGDDCCGDDCCGDDCCGCGGGGKEGSGGCVVM